MDDNGDVAVADTPEVANRLPKQEYRKIAMIGKAPSSIGLAPYDDPSWEIWVLNNTAHQRGVPRWDRHYEIHDLELTKDKVWGDYYPWIKQQSEGKRPVILRDPPPDDFGSAARGFPLEEVKKTFAHLPRIYLTNSVSIMLCHALYEHLQGDEVSDIGIWGVDMAQHGLKVSGANSGWFNSEYAKQRPSVEWWLGLVAGHKRKDGQYIKVHVPAQSDILRAPCIYGHHHTESFKKMQSRRKELEQRIAHAQQIEQQKHDEAMYLAGALESTNYEMQSNVYPNEDFV